MRSIEGVKGLLSDQAADGGGQEYNCDEGQADYGRQNADGAAPVPLVGGHKQYRQTVYPTFTRRLRHD